MDPTASPPSRPQGGSKPSTMEARFCRFLESLPNAESIDRIEWPEDPAHRRKADFLLADRQIVVELKTLTDDPADKVDAIAQPHSDRDEWPLFYGEMDVHKVLRHLPDGATIHKKIVNALGRSVEGAVRSAEEQLSDTKHVLGLPNAVTVLIILNETVEALSPDIVAHRVAQLMRRPLSKPDSPPRIDFAMLLFESHALAQPQGPQARPCILIHGNATERCPWFMPFHEDLIQRWAHFNQGRSIVAATGDPGALKFTSTLKEAPVPPSQQKRSEWWEQQYRSQPYMRGWSDEKLISHGAEIMREVTPYFLKGGPGFVEQAVLPLLEKFSHLMLEMNARGIDMRRIPQR